MASKHAHSEHATLNYDIPAFLQPNRVVSTTKTVKLPSVLVVGVGGAGTNYVHHLSKRVHKNVECMIVDTDNNYISALERANRKVRDPQQYGMISESVPRYLLTNDLQSSLWEEVTKKIRLHRLVVINTGLGGYSGSMLTPRLVKVIQQEQALPIVHCSLPSHLEGVERMRRAQSVVDEIAALGCYQYLHQNEMFDQYALPANANEYSVVHELFDREIGMLAPIAKSATRRISYDEVRAQRVRPIE